MKKARVHLIISGFVQGVFFRASTRDTASRLGLKGWVRNMPDGNVEAVLEGPASKLQEAIAWCQKGPPGASVTHVEETWMDSTGEFDSFDIKYDW